MTDKEFLSLIGIIAFLLVTGIWLWRLSRHGRCPKCDAKLDKAGNDRHCRHCRILYHMNQFGKLIERK